MLTVNQRARPFAGKLGFDLRRPGTVGTQPGPARAEKLPLGDRKLFASAAAATLCPESR